LLFSLGIFYKQKIIVKNQKKYVLKIYYFSYNFELAYASSPSLTMRIGMFHCNTNSSNKAAAVMFYKWTMK